VTFITFCVKSYSCHIVNVEVEFGVVSLILMLPILRLYW